MSDPVFFRAAPHTVAEIVALTGAAAAPGLDGAAAITGVAPLDAAGPGDLAFLDNPQYLAQLAACRAGAILIAPRHAGRAPEGARLLVVAEPYRAMARATAALYPASARPGSWFGGAGVAPGAVVHPDARLEHGVTVDPGAVIGPGVEIGSGSVVGPNAVIGSGVRIGRDCSVGPNACVQHALVGNRVVIHPGVQIGQDGFGFAMGSRGHLKVPQVGRVIIQDDVEIGAGTTIDRGANRDTVVGEGTKIDNQVQIGHNVVIGRHCVLVAKVGISGSTVLEDFVVMAGASATAGHVRIGRGAQIGGAANVKDDVPPGSRMMGTPARPVRRFMREQAALERLSRTRGREPADGQEGV